MDNGKSGIETQVWLILYILHFKLFVSPQGRELRHVTNTFLETDLSDHWLHMRISWKLSKSLMALTLSPEILWVAFPAIFKYLNHPGILMCNQNWKTAGWQWSSWACCTCFDSIEMCYYQVLISCLQGETVSRFAAFKINAYEILSDPQSINSIIKKIRLFGMTLS